MTGTARRLVVCLTVFIVGLCATPAQADGVRPVQVQITEREPGAFLVQWRVPKVLAGRALPEPVLPDGCRLEGERVVVDQGDGWLCRQVFRAPDGIAGRVVGIRYPVANPALSTVFRVELATGERFAHALAPSEDSWRVPEADAGALVAGLRRARSALLAGARHALGTGAHLAFLLALALVAGAAGVVGPVTAFALGQLVALMVTWALDRSFSSIAAEVGLALGAAFLAREGLRADPDARRCAALAWVAGLFHGLGLEVVAVDGTVSVITVLGMDAALLVLAATLALLGRLVRPARWRPLAAYVLGSGAVVAALTLIARPPLAAPGAGDQAQLPELASSRATGLPGSRRVSPGAVTAPVQSFLTVAPYEVRHEVLVRPVELGLELDVDGFVEIDAQPALAKRVAELVTVSFALTVDGRAHEGAPHLVEFMTADATGVLPRPTPVREPARAALIGVTRLYPVDGVPREVALAWRPADESIQEIPATVLDPEAARSVTLTPSAPELRWTNELSEDPIPSNSAVVVEPRRVALSLVSAALIVATLALLALALRRRRASSCFASARVTLALALVAAPLAQVSLALPSAFGSASSPTRARRVLAALLPSVYRAFELKDEALVYDRLAVVVTGDTLADVYLGHRRALELEERGGARARVDAVEVLAVDALAARPDGGFEAEAIWLVGGTVTHYGHRHFRQNRYDARVTVVPVDGHWKIGSIEVLELERVR